MAELSDTAPDPARLRRLKLLVVVLGIIMGSLFLLTLGVIIYRIGGLGQSPQSSESAGPPPVPAGATLIDWQLDGDRIALRYRLPDGSDLFMIGPTEGPGEWTRLIPSTASP